MQLAKLKINIKSLAQEARYNRKEADKLGEDRWSLDSHRRYEIRHESRAAQWAYAYARGIPKTIIEPKARPLDHYHRNWFIKRVCEKLRRLGIDTGPDASKFLRWLEETA